jgi:cell division inhibitor SepF
MPLRDSWHKTLVYFGLADEPDDYDYDTGGAEPEAVLEDRYRERPNVRRLQGRRRRDDFDDIFSDESDERPARSRPIQLRSVQGGRVAATGRGSSNTATGEFGVHLVIPKSFNDAQQVADKFKDGIPVILNMQGIETTLVVRMIDFASGLTYALEGGMQRIADKVFMLTPRNVELSAEERARLIEKGFFNQA